MTLVLTKTGTEGSLCIYLSRPSQEAPRDECTLALSGSFQLV